MAGALPSRRRLIEVLQRHLAQRAFTLEDVAVIAWQVYPQDFCLRGYPQHPDIRRVSCIFSGPKGLVRQGWVRALGNGLYCLADRATPWQPPPEIREWLQAALHHRVWKYWRLRCKNRIRELDALSFLAGRQLAVRRWMPYLCRLAERSPEHLPVLDDGYALTPPVVQALWECICWLRRKYKTLFSVGSDEPQQRGEKSHESAPRF
jgi:hypothetical protein